MKNTKVALNKGFSLVEMLVVIAVIGIIAAIAVPQIGRINESAKDATNRRNAQSIASIYASAQAAGYDFDADAGNDQAVATIVGAIVTGKKITEQGPFYNAFFGVPNLSAQEKTGASGFLSWDANSSSLIYTGAPQN